MSDGVGKADLYVEPEEKSAELRCPEMRGYNMVWSLLVGHAMWQDSKKGEAGRERITKGLVRPFKQKWGFLTLLCYGLLWQSGEAWIPPQNNV